MSESAATKRKKVNELGAIQEVITPAAAAYAKARGLDRSVELARNVVRELIPSVSALEIDLKKDPDEGGYSTICFRITTAEPVAGAVKSYRDLQRALYERVPARDRMYLSFTYHFQRSSAS